MGRTDPKGGQAFQIVYEGAKSPTFAPGDTIIGHCRRQLPLVSTDATIKVTLCGRTKSKITISSGNSTSYYRGRFTVIDEHAHLQTIFQGPIHIASGEGARTWPFAIDIPTHCCPKRLVNAAPEKQSYLPLDAATIATHRLPDSFEMHHSGFSSTREGFVEYFIKATLDYMHHGSRHFEHAIIPFNLTMTTNEPPITDFRLQQRRILGTVTSFKLLPDMEKTELSFSQKRQTFFNSLKVPRIGGNMEITVPRLVQIGNTSPIPIQLRFVPTPDDRFTTPDMRGIPVKIILSSLHMEIVARSEVRCEGTFSPHEADDKMEHRVQLWPQLLQPGQLARDPLYIPWYVETGATFPPFFLWLFWESFCSRTDPEPPKQGVIIMTNIVGQYG
jgi:hypothetical protein